ERARGTSRRHARHARTSVAGRQRAAEGRLIRADPRVESHRGPSRADEELETTMNKSAPAELLDRICMIAREAGEVIMPYFESDDLITHRKSDRSQVTAADRAAETLIIGALSKLTPGTPIVAEEAVEAGHVPDVAGKSFWLVDPVDGTKEFIQRIPEFTVNIALVENGQPVLGVVYAPASDLLYAGMVPGGAFVEEHGERRAISARRVDPDGITVALSRTYGSGVELD